MNYELTTNYEWGLAGRLLIDGITKSHRSVKLWKSVILSVFLILSLSLRPFEIHSISDIY